MTMSDAEGNELATYQGQAVRFDADGNLVWGPVRERMEELKFDSRNRLVEAGGVRYQYDAENQRIGMDGIRYVVNSQPLLSQVLVREEGGRETFYVYGLGLLGEEREGKYLSYHFDVRGSTIALSDENGEVVDRFGYGPYGELVSGDATQTPFLFNGQYGVMSDGNGLYYMRARFYSPLMKRFVNRDVVAGEVGRGQSLNRFAFVEGNPVRFVDPFGLFATKDGISLGLDFLPVIGSCKGVAELVLGKDPITGEEIPRWIAIISIIPYGKSLTKGEKIADEFVVWYHGSLDVEEIMKKGFGTKNKYGEDRGAPYVCVSTDCEAAQNAINPKARYDAQFIGHDKTGIVMGKIARSRTFEDK